MSTAPIEARDDLQQQTMVVSLWDYVRIVRRRLPSLAAGVAAGLAAGLFWYVLTPATYEARATITVTPITDDLFTNTPTQQLVNTATESVIMRSDEVTQRAADGLGDGVTARGLRERLTVGVPADSSALEAIVTSDDAAEAARQADAVASAYLAYRGEVAEDRRSAYLSELSRQLDELTAQLADLDPDEVEAQSLLQQITIARQQLGEAASLNIDPGRVVSAAAVPDAPASPRLVVAVAAGLALGLLLGLGLVALRHRTDDRLFAVEDLRSVTTLPVLGTVPVPTSGTSLTGADADAAATASLHALAGSAGRRPRSVLVVRAELAGPTGAAVLADNVPPGDLKAHHVRAEDLARVEDDPASGGAVLVVDGVGLTGRASVLTAMKQVDAVVVAVEAGTTSAEALASLLDELAESPYRRPVLGVLLLRRPVTGVTNAAPRTSTTSTSAPTASSTSSTTSSASTAPSSAPSSAPPSPAPATPGATSPTGSSGGTRTDATAGTR